MTRGYYIAFEGIEGSGKSTQAQLLAKNLKRKGFRVVQTREPGGTPEAERIRQIILGQGSKINELTEAYLFAASRAQSLREVVGPAIKEGKIVVVERSFYSSLVYQGLGRGLGIDRIWQINKEAVGRIKPDLVVLADISPQAGFERLGRRGRGKDRIEEEGTTDFYKRIRKGYLDLARKDPKRWLLLDAMLSVQVQGRIIVEEALKRIHGKSF